jgi:hypothetical protein
MVAIGALAGDMQRQVDLGKGALSYRSVHRRA